MQWKRISSYFRIALIIGTAACIFYFFLNWVFHLMFNSDVISYDCISQNIIIALIGGLASGLLVDSFSRHLFVEPHTENSPVIKDEVPPSHDIKMDVIVIPSKDDMDTFCKSVIAWKVAASKKDEMFSLFKDNPYYLMGYLTFITQRNIQETDKLQRTMGVLTVCTVIIAAGALLLAFFTLIDPYIKTHFPTLDFLPVIAGIVVSAIILVAIGIIVDHLKNR